MSDFEIPQYIKDNVGFSSMVWPLLEKHLRFCGSGASDQFKKHFTGNVVVTLRNLGLINEDKLAELLSVSTDRK